MTKLALMAGILALLAVGCQEKPAASTSGAGPAAAVAETPVPADQVALPAGEEALDLELAPSAGADQPAGSDLAKLLAHRNFVIQSWDGQAYAEKGPHGEDRPRPNLSFGQWPYANGRICNSFRGQVETEGRVLTMRNAASTMMLCSDPELNKLENTFHETLRQGATVDFDGQILTLRGAGHVLIFKVFDYVFK